MPFDPSSLTNDQRSAASRAVTAAGNKVFALDRSALGPEYTLVLTYAYSQVDEILHDFAAEIIESGPQFA